MEFPRAKVSIPIHIFVDGEKELGDGSVLNLL